MLKDCPVTAELAESLVTVIHRVEGELVTVEEDVLHLVTLLSGLARQSLTYCSPSALADTLELAAWQGLGAAIHQESHSGEAFAQGAAATDPYTEWRFTPLYCDRGLPLDKTALLPLVRRCLGLLLPCVDQAPLPYLPRHAAATVVLQDLDVTAPDLEAMGGVDARAASLGLGAAGGELVAGLQQAGQAMLAFRALQAVDAPLASLVLGADPDTAVATQGELTATRSLLLAQLVPKILGEGRADLPLALGFISCETRRAESLKLLAKINSSLGLDYRRVAALALVGAEHCRLLELTKQRDQFLELYVRACWARRTADLGISFNHAFNGSKANRVAVLREMVGKQEVDVATLLLYTRAFAIDRDEALTIYSEALLGTIVPRIGERGAVVADSHQATTANIHTALRLVSEDKVVFAHLEAMFAKTCPYNYSALQVVLARLQETAAYRERPPGLLAKADRLLGFLMQYRRVAPPVMEWEVDPWVKERAAPFPRALAALRLPLTALCTLSVKDKFKLLEKEFTMETYPGWINIAGVLGMVKDNILYWVVKNTVTAMLEQQEATDAWVVSHVNKSVLQEVQACITHFDNSQKAAAASNWVLNRLPPGSDKVLAARGLEVTVRRWEGGGKVQEQSLQHATTIRRQLESEEVLHSHGLAQAAYLALVQQNKPIQLVNALFEDPSIEARSRVAAGDHPDINAAAEAIAGINELNLVKMKYELLDRWLPLASAASPDDTLADFTLDLGAAREAGVEGGEESSLLRCIYLLQAGTTDGLQYLLKYAFTTDPVVTTSHKLRALKCLLATCSEEELEAATGHTLEQLQDSLKRLVYLARLEGLGLPYSQDSLTPAAVPALVEAVWRTCRLSPAGVTLVRDLCAEYGVWAGPLWAALLAQMVKYSMAGELRAALRLLGRRPALWNCPGFVAAWDCVLQAPLATLLPPATREAEARVAEALHLLTFCPVAGEVDLATLARECLRVNLGHLATSLLPYLGAGAGGEPWDTVRALVVEEKVKDKVEGVAREGVVKVEEKWGCQSSGAL